MPRSRSIVALTLAAALVPLPGHAAPAPKPAQPPPDTSTTSATGNAGPTMGTVGTAPAPADADAPPTDASDTPPAEGETPPAEGEPAPDAVPVEEAAEPEPPPAELPAVSEGPERPPEPTLGNGKFKAKGTGLMISGGVLFGLGAIGVVTTALLTRCEDLDNSFACKNRQHNTFAVPATATVALLGAVLLAVGVAYRVRYKRWENWNPNTAKTAFRPVITGSGIGVKF